MSQSLLADIGGSKSRFALANAAGRPERILVIDNDEVAGFEGAVARYLDETGVRPRSATLAIAGPINDEEIVLTNRAWRFRRGDLARRFGLSALRVVNDFEAIAWALPALGAAETRQLGAVALAEARPEERRDAVKLVLGPGTGLGVAALLPIELGWRVVASEGGHSALGPRSADEVPAFEQLWKECGSVSAECVLSGAGLVRLARALDRDAASHPPETIVASALAREPAALAATRMFVRLLGRFAGSMALTFKAAGGVYIAGGVASGLGPLLDEPHFRAAFETHPPHQSMLAQIPTLLVTCEEPGLIGCAVMARATAEMPV